MGLDPTNQGPDPTTPANDRPWEDVPTGMKVVAAFFVVNFFFLLVGTSRVFAIGGSAAAIVGTVMLALSAVGILSAYGLVLAKPWGYLGAIAVTVLLLALSLFSLQILRSLLLVVILYYLYTNGDVYRPDRRG